MEKRRLNYVDITKGIAIFLVVLGHTYRGNIVQNWLYSFHMPLFFFISGWLYKEKNFEQGFFAFALKKSRRLLVPYFVFLVLNFLYWILVERHFRSFDQGPLWFLPILLIVECIVAILVKYLGKNNGQFVVALFVLLIGFLCIGKAGIEFDGVIGWIVRCYNGIFWYYVGFWLSRHCREQIEALSARKVFNGLFVLTCFILNILSGCNNGRVDMYANRFNNIFLYVFAALSGIFFCMGISALIRRNKALEYMGKNSLIIMCTHEPIKRAVIQVTSIVLHIPSDVLRNKILAGFVLAIVVVLIEVIVIEVLRFLSRVTKEKKIHILFEYV